LLFQSGIVCGQVSSQLINFWDNTYLINSASVTPKYKSEFIVSNRSQWVGVQGAPKTLMFTGSYCNTDFTSQIGAKIASDKIGYSDIIAASLTYSYYIDFAFSRLSFGLAGNYTNFNFDPTKITSFETSDPYLNFAYEIKNKINSDVGVEFTNESSRMGMSIENLFDLFSNQNNFNQNINYLYYIYRSQNDALFNLGCGFALINNRLNTQFEFNINSYIRYDLDEMPLQLGFTIRTWNQYAFNGGLYLGENIKILYTFELNRSVFGRQTNGTHELMLRYRINRGRIWGSRNYFENQKFFY
jgi:type IX secretion system PorP/SprF family membrane protein